jgi:hypothetical protein
VDISHLRILAKEFQNYVEAILISNSLSTPPTPSRRATHYYYMFSPFHRFRITAEYDPPSNSFIATDYIQLRGEERCDPNTYYIQVDANDLIATANSLNSFSILPKNIQSILSMMLLSFLETMFKS